MLFKKYTAKKKIISSKNFLVSWTEEFILWKYRNLLFKYTPFTKFAYQYKKTRVPQLVRMALFRKPCYRELHVRTGDKSFSEWNSNPKFSSRKLIKCFVPLCEWSLQTEHDSVYAGYICSFFGRQSMIQRKHNKTYVY